MKVVIWILSSLVLDESIEGASLIHTGRRFHSTSVLGTKENMFLLVEGWVNEIDEDLLVRVWFPCGLS